MISSRANAAIKRTVRLRKQAEREKRGVFLVEGHRAAAVAIARGVRLLDVFHTAAAQRQREDLLRAMTGVTMRAVTPGIMAYLTGHDHPPDLLAIAPLRPATIRKAIAGDVTVVMSGVRDPRVAGGVLAAAAGVDAGGVIALPGTTDLFAPACVRAAAGAHFAVPIASSDDPAALAAALDGRRVVVLSEHATPVCSDDMRPPIAFIVAEGSVPESFAGATRVCVPAGASGVAPGLAARAAVALYESRRP